MNLDLTSLGLGIPYLQKRKNIGFYITLNVKHLGHGWYVKNVGFSCPLKEVELLGGGIPTGNRQVGRPPGIKNSQDAVSKCLQWVLASLLTSQRIVSNSLTTWCLGFLICKMESTIEPISWGCSEDWVKVSKHLKQYLVCSKGSINVSYYCSLWREWGDQVECELGNQGIQNRKAGTQSQRALSAHISLDLIKAIKVHCRLSHGLDMD